MALWIPGGLRGGGDLPGKLWHEGGALGPLQVLWGGERPGLAPQSPCAGLAGGDLGVSLCSSHCGCSAQSVCVLGPAGAPRLQILGGAGAPSRGALLGAMLLGGSLGHLLPPWRVRTRPGWEQRPSAVPVLGGCRSWGRDGLPGSRLS